MVYEICLGAKDITARSWVDLLKKIQALHVDFQKWCVFVRQEETSIRYYVKTPLELPTTLESKEFYFCPTKVQLPKLKARKIKYCSGSYIAIKNYLALRKAESLECVEITSFRAANNEYVKVKMRTGRGDYWLPGANASELLAINFKNVTDYQPKLVPKFLDIHKTLPYLNSTAEGAILKVSAFPYFGDTRYLGVRGFDLDRHGLVLGASGSGKSKLISLMIARVLEDKDLSEEYRFLVIDPHAALVSEIGGASKVVDFENVTMDLFSSDSGAPILTVELLIEVFRGLLEESWNSRLERVLRHSFYLLIVNEALDFVNLRRVLLELPYRNELLKKAANLPESTLNFFQMEYSEIKNRNYTEAVSPIIMLIDEVEMIPAFGAAFESAKKPASLSDYLLNNKVTLVSLEQGRLGRKGSRTIAGLVMLQVANLIRSRDLGYRLIMVVDEIAVVANPVLAQLLSEARKFGLHVVLVGQYFGMVPEYLRAAILSNVTNYFLFRIMEDDARVLKAAIDMKIPLDNTPERMVKTLSRLNDRECIVQVSMRGKMRPALKAKTLEFGGTKAEKIVLAPLSSTEESGASRMFVFGEGTRFNLYYVLHCFSTGIVNRKARSLEKKLIWKLRVYGGGREFQYKEF